MSGLSRLRMRENGQRRRAATVVEMAVVSPILITLLFGIIEFGWAFMVRQMLTNAAREGVRVAAIQTVVDDDEIITAVQDAMAAVSWIEIEANDIDITHWCIDEEDEPNFTETVQVTLPYDDISLLAGYFSWLDFNDLVAVSTMRKEGVTEDSDPPGTGECG